MNKKEEEKENLIKLKDKSKRTCLLKFLEVVFNL